ncbi:MAG: universal stress protein [Rhodospirillaceae bacterium]
MLKHIILPMTGVPDSGHVALCALSLAQRLEAHVTAGPVEMPEPVFILPMDTLAAPLAYAEYARTMEQIADVHRRRARADFDHAVAVTRLPIATKPLCAQGSAEWLDSGDSETNPARAMGPLGDLVVVNAPGDQPRGVDWQVVEDALFTTKRPALVLPAGSVDADFTRPLVAWNGSDQAANAVRGALDLFEASSPITILQVGALRAGGIAADRLADSLGWHYFETAICRVADAAHRTGAIILEQAKAQSAGVIVLGAYGHSRTREFILGGVTNFLLRHSTVPLLLAH